MNINEDVKPRKRTRVKPGYIRHPETSLLKTREAIYFGGGFMDDDGRYHLYNAYVLLREDWEDYHDFLFAPSAEALLEGRFVAQFVGNCIVTNVLEKVYIEVEQKDFLEVIKKHLEQVQ